MNKEIQLKLCSFCDTTRHIKEYLLIVRSITRQSFTTLLGKIDLQIVGKKLPHSDKIKSIAAEII